MFVCDIDVKNQFLGVILQCFYGIIEFTAVKPLFVDEYPYLCDELTVSFYSHFFASNMSEILLLCMFKGCGNDSYNYR